MGWAKQHMMEIEDRGYGESDKLVCHECTGDYALKNFIRDKGSRNICDYCGNDRKCVTLGDLMSIIMPGILREYEDAANSMGWDSAEGGYLGTTYTSHELIYDILWDELAIDNTNLLEDIGGIMNDITWCKRDPYGDSEEDTAYYTWNSFARLVKEKVRYVFYKVDSKDSDWYSQPSEILEQIGEYVLKSNLFRILNYRAKLLRGRTHGRDTHLSKVSDFGPPPTELARANRMSPEGIPMFYGAFDIETTLAEIYCDTDECASIAEFRPLR